MEDIKSGYFWLNDLIKNKDKFIFRDNDTLKTNISLFDKFTNGLVKQQLYVLAARPSVGKTTLLLNIILRSLKNLKDNEIIVFLSLEMSVREILNRITILLNNLDVEMSYEELIKSKKLLIIDYVNSNVNKIGNFIEDISKHFVIKSLMIDHLQLLELDKNQSNLPRYEKMTLITRQLKIVAREKNINILAISQLSRDFEKRNANTELVDVQLSDLRDSGSIEQDADVVFFLTKLKNKEYNNKHSIIIAKNRNGSCSQISCLFFNNKFLFTFFEDSKCFVCDTFVNNINKELIWNNHLTCSKKCFELAKERTQEYEIGQLRKS
ncbi:DnaB-like helicase C-terminal domain-containing protein [Metamycoplasma equirhinis]|uniref:DnaB-like helicase C-terminal domain-containing protein n=1 Tax=Metamycoplasma equirhinis TaxID=92402 RepID=UPI00257321B3|nr:DnaB-like helicase C-terminal domain-containing protein [Metamycoplasma equirhinis]BDX52603.1 hypothetical protein JPM7_2100 [Metamycoplasma equirhinis]